MSIISNIRARLFPRKKFTPVNEFQFHDLFPIDTVNGLIIKGCFIPEEVLTSILSYVGAKQLLSCSLVCKMWCNVIKSGQLWRLKYSRAHPKRKVEILPWYVYYSYFATENFERNLLKNGSAELGDFTHWNILENNGDGLDLELGPEQSLPIPRGIEDFNGSEASFVTSNSPSVKIQFVDLSKKRLLRYIMDKHKPYIHASEWIATHFYSDGIYSLILLGFHCEKDISEWNEGETSVKFCRDIHTSAKKGSEWKKMEITVDDYECNITHLGFLHGTIIKRWDCRRVKMSGAVLKIMFAFGRVNNIPLVRSLGTLQYVNTTRWLLDILDYRSKAMYL